MFTISLQGADDPQHLAGEASESPRILLDEGSAGNESMNVQQVQVSSAMCCSNDC